MAKDSDHERFMLRALQLADDAAAMGEVPVGAVVVRDGIIIGEGYNCPISSCDPSAHAEVVAIRDAATRVSNYRLPGTTLYVTLEPCTMCLGVMIHARIANLCFAASEPRAGVVGGATNLLNNSFYNHHITIIPGPFEADSRKKLQGFFQSRRKTNS